jgi:hypothetical protein
VPPPLQEPFPCSLSQLEAPPGAVFDSRCDDAADLTMLPVGGVCVPLAPGAAPAPPHQLAAVLLSNSSGFWPAVMAAQGNQLLRITPWQVCHMTSGARGGTHLQRCFEYRHTTAGGWGGPVTSRVLQQQVLQLAADGRLRLEVTQSMPDLPAGACCGVVGGAGDLGDAEHCVVRGSLSSMRLRLQPAPNTPPLCCCAPARCWQVLQRRHPLGSAAGGGAR